MKTFIEKPVWMVLILVLLGGLAGTLIGQFVAISVVDVFSELDVFSLLLNPTDQMRIPLLIIQGFTAICGFVVMPFWIWKSLRKETWSYFLHNSQIKPLLIVVMFIIMVMFIVVDTVIVEWNQTISFPEVFSSFAQWAKAKEDQMMRITKMITNFQSVTEFVLGFLVVAVVAGICEEFLFRGIIQTEIFKGTRNVHVAIWVSSFLFSAIHLQFFGFVPRMLLGALFGYMYYWSGNFLVPVLMHIFNNGFAIGMIYLYKRNVVSTDIEEPKAAAWYLVLPCLILGIVLLNYFKSQFSSNIIRS